LRRITSWNCFVGQGILKEGQAEIEAFFGQVGLGRMASWYWLTASSNRPLFGGRSRVVVRKAAAGDYIDGGKELSLALQSLPDNGEIPQLTADYKLHEPEQIERLRVE